MGSKVFRARAVAILLASVATWPVSVAWAQATTAAERGAQALAQGRCDAALDALNEGLKEGDADAYYTVGLMYLKGYCVKADPARSPAYFEPAAKAAQPQAAKMLVMMHGLGIGVPQSYARAGQWFFAWSDIARLLRQRKGDGADAPAAAASTPAKIGVEQAVSYGVLGTVAAAVEDRVRYPRAGALTGADRVSFDLMLALEPSGLSVRIENNQSGMAEDAKSAVIRRSAQPHEDVVREAIDEIIRTMPTFPLPKEPATLTVPYRFDVVYRRR